MRFVDEIHNLHVFQRLFYGHKRFFTQLKSKSKV
jgi:hypothetical protein